MVGGMSPAIAVPNSPAFDVEPSRGPVPNRVGRTGARVVRVWFSSRVVCEHPTETAAEAAEFAEGMRRRFAGLRITDDPDDRTDGSGGEAA